MVTYDLDKPSKNWHLATMVNSWKTTTISSLKSEEQIALYFDYTVLLIYIYTNWQCFTFVPYQNCKPSNTLPTGQLSVDCRTGSCSGLDRTETVQVGMHWYQYKYKISVGLSSLLRFFLKKKETYLLFIHELRYVFFWNLPIALCIQFCFGWSF